jgi:branched-chain amino acid transport system permease protein
MTKKITVSRIVVAASALILLLFPLTKTSNYTISVLCTCMLFASFGQAWNIIGGYGGQISWCHSAFVAIGGYTAIMCRVHLGWSPIFTLLLGVIFSVIFATVIGIATLRYSGTFFAIATIAFAEILRVLLLNFPITGGSSGLAMPYLGENWTNLAFRNDIPIYYVSFGVMILSLLITWRFTQSKLGYFLRAIKGNEVAAKTLGVNTGRTRVLAFQISAAMSSVAGAVYACFTTFVEPYGWTGLDMAVRIGAAAIVGGSGTLFGPILGAFILTPAIELAGYLLGSSGGTQILYGLFLIVVSLCLPTGVITVLNKDYWLHLGWVKKLCTKKMKKEKPT